MTPAINPLIDLATMPDRMRALPIASNGYPVPWFVAKLPNGEFEFRAIGPGKFELALKAHLCWVCGQRLGSHLAFVLGPMCTISRTTSEPPCHRECATWSARNCPFLTRPRMHRREDNLPEGIVQPAGVALDRNPGVAAVWVTHDFEIFPDPNRRPLIHVGDPEDVEWWAQGKPATRAQVEESVRTGLPFLEELAVQQTGGMEALRQQVRAGERFFPRA